MLFSQGLVTYAAKRLMPIEDSFETCAGALQGSEFTCAAGGYDHWFRTVLSILLDV